MIFGFHSWNRPSQYVCAWPTWKTSSWPSVRNKVLSNFLCRVSTYQVRFLDTLRHDVQPNSRSS